MNLPPVTSRIFSAVQSLDLAELAKCSQRELRPLLSSLVRMSFLWPFDSTGRGQELRRQVFTIVIDMESVNNIVALLQVSYYHLDIEVRKEQQLRQKCGQQQDTAQFYGLQSGVALGFERAEVIQKVRIVLSELFYLQAQIVESQSQVAQKNESVLKRSDLFDNEIYLEEIADIICIAMAELPFLFTVQEIVDILLYLHSGQGIICWVIANMPDCFKDVVNALIANGDEETPEGRLRLQSLYALCEMNPSQALSVRALCVDSGKMPSLMVKLSLKDPQDLISFVSGLLLGNDQGTRSWFAVFIRTSQKRKGDALQAMRDELLKQLQALLTMSMTGQLHDEGVVQSAQLLRLYCALRCIAGIKFNDEEIILIMQLITTKPPPTSAGIRFVSLGLCMLIACPSLIQQTPHETRAVEWIQWLIKEELYFGSKTGEKGGSFGEMLLLMAIHFHSNQVTAICDLVCATLGMKIPLRPNTTNRIKQIFVQDIFTEQVVTAHAVKVSVTPSLNANIPGYLPVHCIHQLLKSRAFSKHKVPIKSWIYKQICNSTAPLHPVLPALIEVYVNSIIVPNSKTPIEHTHKALSEEEILKVFQKSIVSTNLTAKKRIYTYDYAFEAEDSNHPAASDELAGTLSSVTSQLLVLYYLMLYEDVRLANMSIILANGRKVKSYSTEFMTELPIKYLLQQAQKNQHELTGLFSPLLKLLATHFPHLTLVDDWLDEESIKTTNKKSPAISQQQIVDAFETLQLSPAKAIKLLRLMMNKCPTDLWPFAEIFIRYFKYILAADVPRLVQELYKQIWVRLNTILPRRLWVMSINALMPEDYITKSHLLSQELMLSDPLQVLRCDSRVFRCPDALAVVLRILQASLAASKSQLTRHILDKPLLEKSGQLQTELEREELKMALVASQESVAVQILLESCLETKDDAATPGGLCFLRESRGIICSYIHQAFICEPSLAKLVHFQGYPRELLSMTVRGIPSMHICLDFLHELLNMPEMGKQIFAIDLTSHLSLQYALPKSLSIAKLCINTLTTLLGILTNDTRVDMFRAILPCVVRFAEAFPPLLDDCVMFLMQLGRIAQSQAALGRSNSLPNLSMSPVSRVRAQTKRSQIAEKLVEDVRETFSQLLDQAVLKPKIY